MQNPMELEEPEPLEPFDGRGAVGPCDGNGLESVGLVDGEGGPRGRIAYKRAKFRTIQVIRR
jgi:hypothetical protein